MIQFLAGLLVIAILLFGVMTFFNLSDPVGLGVKEGKLAPLPKTPNAVSSQAPAGDDRAVDPLPFKGSEEESMAAIIALLPQVGTMEILVQDETYLHAVAKSALMGYRDDVEFYFDEAAKQIHFRSASRVGYSDKGVNRQRYDAIRALYLVQDAE
ncbi:MAG: DUF1499 domain-containing protein [Cohaesibacter sp.]|jgi:uncharacterized protein (DUF1499 family)|nr:DUF1499 domain-containing protein [Cohaesibacter sp.]